MVASVSWFIFEFISNGINLNILISMAIHRNIQLVLDIAMTVLIIRIDKFMSANGLFK